MPDKGFVSFSLESLGKMNLLSEEEYQTYLGYFLAQIDSNSDRKFEMFRYPCRINAYIAMLCVEGSVEIISNLKHYKIETNCIYVSMPKDIIQLCDWSECKLYLIAFDDDFIRKTNLNYNNVLSVLLGIQKHPCVVLSPQEATSLQDTFFSLKNEMEVFKGKDYYNEIVMGYINLITYKACSYLNCYLQTLGGESDTVNKRSEEYYNKFMSLLNQNFKHERSIGFYAAKLYITPKYMTSLIKKTSGRSAMDWINDYVIMEAKNLLKYSDMSIQEISEYLNFSNQSFFAQYFRRFTSCSPSDYRDKPYEELRV
jgi:AraC family transcriptional regulator, transcriptional activator of pobA